MDKCVKKLLDDNCSLVVSNHGEMRAFRRPGVADLVDLLLDDPDFLRGATVADKIVGKAAASLMIKGGVDSVFAKVATPDALAMFGDAGIPCDCLETTGYVSNRDHTGRCPLDTICSTLTDPEEMVGAILRFLHRL